MKKQLLLITIVLLSTLLSCKKEENDYNSDDSFDIKASKMEQIGGLFEAIARQPEMADKLINATELNYTDYSVLLPLSDQAIVQRGKARGYAFGMLFYSVAVQPEIFNKLDSAATKFLGKYNSDDISDELLDITRTYSVEKLNESMARQPEADSLFNVLCKRYLNFDISTR
jgi:F0F1-type ATP synthase membrane subunit c/vacuolar-type H+-ATPase subunit K